MAAESVIANWYREKTIFITGATGFIGKVLVEKLIRSCPEMGQIYVLVRNKKGTLPQDRVDEILTFAAFDEVRSAMTKRKERLLPIPGDIGLPNLGISSADRQLLQKSVSVVFHVAATVRFNEPLKTAMAMNVRGTEALMEMCLGMSNLRAIVYVSTAYSNCILPVIEERVYPPPADLNMVKNCVASLSDDLLEVVTPRLIGNYPNTYTFSKALAEQLVSEYSTKLPIVIVRPSIVSASWREPIRGWVDNLNGPTGVVAAASKGFLKSMYGGSQLVADLIPVDVCVNLIIAAAWEIGIREGSNLTTNVRVYHSVSRKAKPLLWAEFGLTLDRCTRNYASGNAFLIPKLKMTDNRVMHVISNILELDLPAIFADIYVRMVGGTPRYQRFRRKVVQMASVLEYFTTREYEFTVDNVKELANRLSPADKVTFNFDPTNIHWEEYLIDYFLGIRRYVMNEKDDTIPAARRRILIKQAVQIAILFIFTIILVLMFFSSYIF